MKEKEPRWHAAQNTPKEEGAPVSEEDLTELREIAQRVGGDFAMRVEIGQAGKGSYFDPEQTSITLDPEHVAKYPDMAKFVALHEGAHRAITPGPRALGLSREEVAKLYAQLGFGYLQNVIEDGAVNTWGRSRFPGITDAMKAVYDEQFSKENAVLSTPAVEQFAARLGYWPKFASAGSEYLRDWHQGRYSTALNPQVEKTVRRTGKTARQTMDVIPDPTATVRDEREILRSAQRRFRTTMEAIWPEFKKLVEADLHTESLRQMVNDQEAYQQMPHELKDTLEQAQEQWREKQEGEAGEALPPAAEPSQAEGAPLPVDDLSDETKKQLEEIWEGLPFQKRQDLEQRAADELEKFEDELNKSLRGKLQQAEDVPETHEKRHERERREREATEKSQREEEDRRRLEEHMEKQRREQLSDYERIRAEVQPLIDDLYHRLRTLLLPEEFGGEEAGWPSGTQADMSRAIQAEADPIQRGKLWIREAEPERRNYRFWHLVDVSGSMEGDPIIETLKGVVVASEAVDRLESRNTDTMTVHQGISAFHNRYFEIKDPGKRVDSVTTGLIARLPDRTADHDSGTDTYQATQHALEALRRDLGESGNYLLTFTDGEPNRDVRVQLAQLLGGSKQERTKKRIKIGLVWLGHEADEQAVQRLVEQYGYDFGLAMPAVAKRGEADFARRLGDLVGDIVRNPDRY